MTKLNRVTAKIFGETATATGNDPQIGQFGSAKAGTYNGTTDVATIQGLSAWSNGWIDAVTPTHQFPTLPEMTGVHKVLSYQEAYLLQQGIPEWDSATTYYTNQFCSKSGKIYVSQIDSNLNNDPASDMVNWKEFTSGGGRNIGEIIASTIPLSDAGLHLLDGALISGSGSYSAFVDYIANLYTSGDYAQIFETEANWQASVATYGVCGKFVYDSVNNTVRLPKITGFIEGAGGVANLGDVTAAGLPLMTSSSNGNHAHSIQGMPDFSNMPRGDDRSGCVSYSRTGATDIAGVHTHTVTWGATTNTVQPQSIKVLYYIVVATSVKTDIEVDIDEIATDLNGKAGLADNNTFTGTNTFNNVVYGQPSSQNNSFLTTVAHDYSQTDKYMKLGNGILIQWGYKEGINSSGVTVTLPQAFNNAYYTILLGRGNYSPGLAENPYWNDRTTSNFKLYCGRSESRNSFWLAIGTY